jgi:GT2 family glycosyltransferase
MHAVAQACRGRSTLRDMEEMEETEHSQETTGQKTTGEDGNVAMLPVSILVPTIGRPELLRDCLVSIAACDPQPAEVLIVDQSGEPHTNAVATEQSDLVVRVLPSDQRSIAAALNLGLQAAAHELALVTNDDCTVRADWVGVAWQRSQEVPGGIVTGMVRPPDDGGLVPSIKTDPEPHDYTGEVVLNGLYGGNMALPRSPVLAIGGFDERPGMRIASEDNDLCYRWLRAGRSLRYEPDMVVWHHDWRTPEEFAQRAVEYSRGNGVLYAKYLLRRDWSMLPYVGREVRAGLRSLVAAVVRRRPRWQDPRRGILRGLPAGLVAGVREELGDRRASKS